MKKLIVVTFMLSVVIINPLYSGEDEWTSIQGPPGGYCWAVDFCPSPFTNTYANSDSFLYVSSNYGLSWETTTHPETQFNDIKIGKSDLGGYYVFTATNSSIYRGLNGTRWERAYDSTCMKIVLDRDQINYIYAIAATPAGTNVMRSTDQGETWVPIQDPGGWLCLEIDPFDPTTIYAGHLTDGLWVSYDAGENWELTGPDNGYYFVGKQIEDVDVSPRNSMVIFVVVRFCGTLEQSEIWRYRPIEEWQRVYGPSGNCENYSHLIISQPSPDTIFTVMQHHECSPTYYSYDEGSTWTGFQPGGNWPRLSIINLSSLPTIDGLFMIATQEAMVRSEDFLNPYSFSFNGLNTRYACSFITAYYMNEGFLICNSYQPESTPATWVGQSKNQYIWRTTDGGNNWQGYPEYVYEGSFAVIPIQIRIVTQDSVYLIGKCGVTGPSHFHISADGGLSYDRVFTPPSPPNISLTNFDVFYKAEDTLYLIGNDGLPSGCHLWRSEYPFSDWVEKTTYISGKGYSLKIHPFNSDILFFGGVDIDYKGCRFWKSTNGGNTYVDPANNGLPTSDEDNNVISSIVTSFSTPDKPVILLCGLKKWSGYLPGGSFGVYKSTDFGDNWQNANLDEEINELKLDLLDQSIIYAATPNGMYVSYDLGSHWSLLNQGLELAECGAIDLSTNRPHLFCGTPHGVFKFSPIKLLSGTPLTTAYQSKKIVIKDNEIWLTYQTPGGIYFGTSDLDGQSKIREFGVKNGEFPTINLDANDYPCAVWQRNVETLIEKGGELWFSRSDGNIWSEPYCLVSFVGEFGEDVNLASFIIDPSTNIGYVAFEERDRFINGPVSRLYLGWFPINNPAGFTYEQLDYAWSPIRCEFPSISLGSDSLHIAFQKEHKIYCIRKDIDTGDTTWLLISDEDRFSHHPYVDVEANGRVNYVWEDSTANNIEIYWAYEYRERFYPQGNVSNTPGTSQWPQICKGTTYITWSEYIYPPQDHNWDIFYKDLEYEDNYNLSGTLEMSKYSHGIITTGVIPPRLTAIWTEGNQSPFEIKAKSVIVNPEPAYFYVNAGEEESSPWTVQREGYIQFASEPEKTIDYHTQKLIYHFTDLNPAKRYRIKLVFYFESQDPDNWKMKVNADNIFYANKWIIPGEIMTLERWLPTTCYEDEEIYLEIENEVGDYALAAQIMIYEYEREPEGSDKSTQEFGTSKTEEFDIFINPNPCRSQAAIRYSVHTNNEQSTACLKIYDASGRLVKRFLRGQSPTSKVQSLQWDGTDENGRNLSNGIYFVILEYGGERLSKKLVLLK